MPRQYCTLNVGYIKFLKNDGANVFNLMGSTQTDNVFFFVILVWKQWQNYFQKYFDRKPARMVKLTIYCLSKTLCLCPCVRYVCIHVHAAHNIRIQTIWQVWESRPLQNEMYRLLSVATNKRILENSPSMSQYIKNFVHQ